MIRKSFREAKQPKFGSASHIIWVFCVWIHHNFMHIARCKCPKQIPYSLEKALLHLVNFLHPKCSTFLRVPLIWKVWCDKEIFSFKPLYPHISIHILHTYLQMFPLVWIRRICFTIKASQVGNHFLYSCDINEWFSSITARRIWMLVTLRV